MLKHVRMTVIPNNGATTTTDITHYEANSIMQNVFMRPGHVRVESSSSGYTIQDQNGQTILTPVYEGHPQEEAE